MKNTTIEWTETTWNPLAGCKKVSPGCEHCYALAMANRFKNTSKAYEGTVKLDGAGHPQWTGKINLNEEALLLPLHWKKPRMIFVNSMSDLFHEEVPFEWIDKVFAVMAICPQHTFQILTKRAGRMKEYFHPAWWDLKLGDWYKAAMTITTPEYWNSRNKIFPIPNVWLGVSAENQKYLDERVPDLLECPAAVRFVSVEPMLGPVTLPNPSLTKRGVNRIDWVICGGESGPNARIMEKAWVESIWAQCHGAGIPFFFKQWGRYVPIGDIDKSIEGISAISDLVPYTIISENSGAPYLDFGKKYTGSLLYGQHFKEFPKAGVNHEGD